METQRVERRLSAVLAADVVGYSRLVGIDEEGTLERLRSIRLELIDPAIATHHGRIIKTTGDGILVEFPSVVDAVRCALAVQRSMAERNAEIAADRLIAFRIGIHLGDVVVDGADLLGDGVNIAARLEGVADPGGISLSEDVWRQIRDKLPEAFVDLGEQMLKNIARPMRVYRIDLAGAAEAPHLTLPLPDKPSIAVLPFQNLSGDPEQEYFTDGMVEDMITGLSRINWLFVIARNSSFAYKGKVIDIKQVGRELGVRYVLEGSLRKGGNRLRITGQLIEAETGTHIWADKYDGVLEDVFDLQDKITETIVGIIEPSVRRAEIERARRKRPENLGAYDLYLRALPHMQSAMPEDAAIAIGYLEEALKLDPNYAVAHAALALCREASPPAVRRRSGMPREGGTGQPALQRPLRAAGFGARHGRPHRRSEGARPAAFGAGANLPRPPLLGIRRIREARDPRSLRGRIPRGRAAGVRSEFRERAGDRGRTGDVQLGNPFGNASKTRAVLGIARLSSVPRAPRCRRVLRRTATRTAIKIELSRTSSEGTNLPERRVDFLRRGEQARREPRVPCGIGGHTGDDPALPQTGHHLLRRRPVDLEADDTGREIVGQRSVKFDVRHLRQAFLELPVQQMDPLGDSWLADALVEPERFAQRPAMLERMEPPGRHECRWRNVFGRDRLHPDLARPPVEGGDYGSGGGPRLRLTPHQPRTARAEHPLVRAGNEEVAAEVRHGRVVHTDSMDAVDAKQRAVAVVPLGVDLSQGISDPADRELDSGAGVNPGHRDHASPRLQRAHDGLGDLLFGCGSGVLVELDRPDRCARPLGAQAKRCRGGVMVVMGGQDVLPLPELQSSVEQAQTHGGSVGQGDLGWIHS